MLKALVFLVFAITLAVTFGGSKDDQKPAEPKAAPYTVTLPPPPDPRTLVTLADYQWGKGGFGSVGLGTFTIKNDNAFPVKDVLVRCDFYGNSGTRLGSGDATIYEVIGAKKSRTFREVNLGFINSQSARAGCRVVAIAR